jgi:hypothetical protein
MAEPVDKKTDDITVTEPIDKKTDDITMAESVDKETDDRNIITYVTRSLEDEEDFHCLRFEFLYRLNIVNHQVKLVRMKSQFQREGQASPAQLDDLATVMRDYGLKPLHF